MCASADPRLFRKSRIGAAHELRIPRTKRRMRMLFGPLHWDFESAGAVRELQRHAQEALCRR